MLKGSLTLKKTSKSEINFTQTFKTAKQTLDPKTHAEYLVKKMLKGNQASQTIAKSQIDNKETAVETCTYGVVSGI